MKKKQNQEAAIQLIKELDERLDVIAAEVAGRVYRGSICGQFNAVLTESALEAEREELRNELLASA